MYTTVCCRNDPQRSLAFRLVFLILVYIIVYKMSPATHTVTMVIQTDFMSMRRDTGTLGTFFVDRPIVNQTHDIIL